MDQRVALIKKMVRAFYPFAKQKLGFNRPVRLFLRHDSQNALNPLAKTAFYNPEDMSVTAYVSSRHPKDVLRSISHELVHHKQNCENRLNNINTENVNEDQHLKELELEANGVGSTVFREWEDTYKEQLETNRDLMENLNMSDDKKQFSGDLTENDTIKEVYVKRAEKVAEQVTKRFGFTFNLNKDSVQKDELKGGDSK